MSLWAGDRVRVRGFASHVGMVCATAYDDEGRKVLHVALDAFCDATGDVPVPYFESELEREPVNAGGSS